MRKFFMFIFVIGFITASIYTFFYLNQFYQSSVERIYASTPEKTKYRLALIVPELGNHLTHAVNEGVQEEAERQEVSMVYSTAQKGSLDQMVRQVEIAIASKVDGIITIGIDHPDFNQVINKATAKGIPVITISVDAPHSLRKAYVGTDHLQAGKLLGSHITETVQGQGKIGVIVGNRSSSDQILRLQGLKEALASSEHIQLIELATEKEGRIQAFENTNELLNRHPDMKAFVGLAADDGAGIVKAIRSRAKLDQFHIFTFGDTPEVIGLLQQGIIDATLIQDPKMMGQKSVQLMLQWLNGENLPLKSRYHTPITIQAKYPEVQK